MMSVRKRLKMCFESPERIVLARKTLELPLGSQELAVIFELFMSRIPSPIAYS
jgi:hypothetical protein